jgi:hypothetical protein
VIEEASLEAFGDATWRPRGFASASTLLRRQGLGERAGDPFDSGLIEDLGRREEVTDRALGLQADAGVLLGRSEEGPPTIDEAASPEARA